MEAVERTKSESKNQLSYTAINASGLTYSSRRLDCAMTLTWGVFPDREVLQPTIVDHSSFKAWKTEAFSLWLQEWAIIYEEDSEAYDLLHCIHDEYFLVNVVDNDFVGGDLFRVFDSALKILEDSSAELDPKKVAQTLKNLFIDGKNC
jgi:methylenetetrahydrofolate reductase (NADPH)